MGITLTDVLLFGKAQSDDVDNATLVIYRRNILRWSALGGYLDIIVKGVSPLSLPDAVANSLQYVKAFGGTEQRDIPDNYLQRQFIYMMDGSYIKVEDLPISAGYRVEFDFQTTTLSSALRNYLGGRASDVAAGGGFRLSKLASGGTTLNRVVLYGFESGTEYYDPTAQFQANTRYKYTYDNGVCTLESGGSVVSTQTFTVTDDTSTNWGINAYTSGSTWKTDTDGIYVYSLKVWNAQGELVMNLVPAVQKGTVPVVGFYDTVSKTFKTATAGTFAAGGEAVPTPDAPMDIVSNNGVLKFTANEANYTADNVTLGYWIRNSNGQPELSPANFYTNMMPVKPNVSYVCFGRNKETDVISGYNRIAWYDADGVWIGNSTYTQNQPGIDVAPSNAAFARFHCNINGTDVTQELVDSYNWVFQQGTAEVPYTPYSPTGIYTDGTVETIEDTIGNTATAEMLLKVGDYQDVQSILDGAVNRQLGVFVLDGTESWSYSAGYSEVGTNACFYIPMASSTIPILPQTGESVECLCSHFRWVSRNEIYNNHTPIVGAITGGASEERVGISITLRVPLSIAGTNANNFKQWLAAQYAAGTPVIVIYPLATPTTESVAGQTLQVQAGDNTLEITQASLNGLELEAQYQAAVSLTIQEVQDANLDPNVEVTIN